MLAVGADGGQTVVVNTPDRSARLLHARCELLDEVVHTPVLAAQARDLRRRVDDRGVVAPAELLADLRQRGIGELAREIHRHLAWIDDVLRPAIARQLVHLDAEALADEVLNPLDRDLRRLALR